MTKDSANACVGTPAVSEIAGMACITHTTTARRATEETRFSARHHSTAAHPPTNLAPRTQILAPGRHGPGHPCPRSLQKYKLTNRENCSNRNLGRKFAAVYRDVRTEFVAKSTCGKGGGWLSEGTAAARARQARKAGLVIPPHTGTHTHTHTGVKVTRQRVNSKTTGAWQHQLLARRSPAWLRLAHRRNGKRARVFVTFERAGQCRFFLSHAQQGPQFGTHDAHGLTSLTTQERPSAPSSGLKGGGGQSVPSLAASPPRRKPAPLLLLLLLLCSSGCL